MDTTVRKRRRRQGKLTVVAGPMFSGKTGKLVAMVDVFTRMGHRVLTVKPAIDSRYGAKDEIHSHDHRTAQALVVDGESPDWVVARIEAAGADKVIFDEAQFFEKERILRVISMLRERGVHVIAAGILYDYKRQPFGVMPDLMGLADERIELVAICQKCGGLARHSERTRGGKGRILIGAADTYIAVCETCHRTYTDRVKKGGKR